MNAERIKMQQERLDRINSALSETGYRIHHQWSNINGTKSKRPYRLVFKDNNRHEVVGAYTFAETAHEKALRLLGKAA